MRVWASAFVLVLACGEPAPPPPPTPPPPRPGLLATRDLASDASFDLSAHDGGALLAYGPPPRPSPGVRVVPLSPLGEARATDYVVDDALPIELTLISEGGRAALAWVAQRNSLGTEIRTSAAFSAGGVSFGDTIDLGLAEPLITPFRGRIALGTGDDGAFLVSHREPPAPCTSGAGECALLTRHRVDRPDTAARGDEPLEVPTPCEPFVVGAVRTGGTWFSALCHRGGTPGGPADTDPLAVRTTVYAIRPAISLAAANEVLVGCTPRHLAPTAEGAALVADCPEGRGVAWQDELGRVTAEIRSATFTLACRGRPVISIEGEGRRLEVPLTAAMSRLEGLLPASIAPEHARAVWTGEAILVASPHTLGEHRELLLDRYQCEDGALTRTNP